MRHNQDRLGTAMIWLLYNVLLMLTAPIWLPYVILKSRRRAEKPNWSERQGEYPIRWKKGIRRIWIHAVSVGEVVAVLPILRELRLRLPSHEILLSVTTSSGHQTARAQAGDLIDHLVYFPIDVARFQLAALQRVRPEVVAIMETELWMNFLWASKAVGATTMLINGRISDRSFPKSRRLKFFYRSLLKHMDRCLMQSDRDRERILELGAKSSEVIGNCKFDQAVEGVDADSKVWRETLGIQPDIPVLVVGSTRGEDEERFVLAALAAPGLENLQVVHAPRHLERVPELALAASSMFGQVGLRSKGESARYLILDSYGELSKVYSIADLVVIGGGFSNLGGQNLVQALAHGKPVLHGPHMQNFRDVAELAALAGATRVCSTPEQLSEEIRSLLHDSANRIRMGEAARELVQSNLGASSRYVEAIVSATASSEGKR